MLNGLGGWDKDDNLGRLRQNAVLLSYLRTKGHTQGGRPWECGPRPLDEVSVYRSARTKGGTRQSLRQTLTDHAMINDLHHYAPLQPFQIGYLCSIGFYRDNGKENGNYYLGFGGFRV